jgi:hypothetical protein
MSNIALDRIVQWLRRPRVRTGVYAAIAVAAIIILSACSAHALSETGLLASITVTPMTTLTATSTRQMRAMGLDADGRIVNIAPRWSVVARGGTITTDGMFTAGAVSGVFGGTVVASADGISGRASITVTP